MASTSGKAANEVFDASKQAKTPTHLLNPPPLNLPAVRLGHVSPAVGYGLFAARDFAAGEFIFHEAPLLTARFNERFSADASLTQGQAAAYRAAALATDSPHRTVTAVAFPALAARFGIKPPNFEDVARTVLDEGMGVNLVPGQGQYARSEVTREEYEAYTGGLEVTEGTLPEKDAREACRDFFRHYAFQVLPTGSGSNGGEAGPSFLSAAVTRDACVYLLGSLINHCCVPASLSLASLIAGKKPGEKRKAAFPPGPNCSWRIGPSGLAQFIKPRHIGVQARRAIREGEQLTWDYGKQEKGFACECDTCRDGLMGGLGGVCGVL